MSNKKRHPSFFMKKFFAVMTFAVILIFGNGDDSAFRARKQAIILRILGTPPIHIFRSGQKSPAGVTPLEIKHIYNLPLTGGASGTIALIEAYSAPTIESDLAVFDDAFGLAACTTKNGCLEKHPMAAAIKTNSNWALETSLDVEWAHAIAPQAKILLVEAKTGEWRELARGH